MLACAQTDIKRLVAYSSISHMGFILLGAFAVLDGAPQAERVYGIPPEQVVGSSIKTKLEVRDGKPVLLRLTDNAMLPNHFRARIGIQLAACDSAEVVEVTLTAP